MISEAKTRRSNDRFPGVPHGFLATNHQKELAELAEDIDGPFTMSRLDAARNHRVQILATIYEKCNLANRVYDTALWVDSVGNIAAIYRNFTCTTPWDSRNQINSPLAEN